MLDVPVPDPLHGDGLRTELAAVGITVNRDDVSVVGGRLVFATLGEDARTTVADVLAAHKGEPPPDVKAAQDRESNLRAAIDTLRQWADDAAGAKVTNTNNTQVTQVVVDRLGVFFDRFADLLENRYL